MGLESDLVTTGMWDVQASAIARAIAAGGGNGKWAPGQSYIGLVATRCKAPSAGSTVKLGMSRRIHTARGNITQIGAAFANWYATLATTGEVPAGGDCTITASIEYPLGVAVHPLTFGGQAAGTARDYTTLASDLLTLSIPDGAQFAVREFRSYPGAGGVVCSSSSPGVVPDIAAGDGYTFGPGTVDLTGVPGAIVSTGTVTLAPPVAVFGPTTQMSYALFGDSRGEGVNDPGSASLYTGELERAIGPTRAYTNLCIAGEFGSQAAGSQFRQRMAIASTYTRGIVCQYGVNDVNNVQSADTILWTLEKLRLMFPRHWYYQCTLPPWSTSTDAWATVANQTPHPHDNNRVFINNYLRAGVTPYDGIFDIASVVESSVNSGKWLANYTTDGIHETAAANALIAAAGVIKIL